LKLVKKKENASVSSRFNQFTSQTFTDTQTLIGVRREREREKVREKCVEKEREDKRERELVNCIAE
jgi:hypothetical protein